VQEITEEHFNEIYKNMIEEFDKFCQVKDSNPELREKRKSLLRIKKQQCKQRCLAHFNLRIAEFIEDKSKLLGLSKINEIIKDLLSQNKTYTKQ